MKRTVLLVNLGSPDSTRVEDVRSYLNEFLMDRRVMDLPYPLRRFIVSFFVLRKRPAESARAYASIWTAEGSPLVTMTRKVAGLLAARLGLPVEYAMRYGKPTADAALISLTGSAGGNAGEVFLVPLYPHYAMSSYETAVEDVKRAHRNLEIKALLRVLPPFYNRPDYVDALAASAGEYLVPGYDHFLFSFHGLPERHLRKSDPTGRHCLSHPSCCETPSPAHATCYRHQVLTTARLLSQKLEIPPSKYSVAFQSRLGRDPWLAPATDAEFTRLARSGVKKLLVICPAFVSDCLETLEEIGERGRETFLNAGGKEFRLIPCMNDHPRWIETLAQWCTAA